MRMLLHLSLLALGAAHVCANPTARPTSALVKETLALLSTHRTLLMVNETLRIPVPAHKNHQLCTEEIFQGIGTLENQIVQGSGVEKLFQNLSLIKEHIDRQKVKKVWTRKTKSKAIPRLPARISWCNKHRVDNRKLRLNWFVVDKDFRGGHFTAMRMMANEGLGLNFQCN
nr:interleukin-5 isoform X1 [Aotus nancymaae]